MTICFRCSSKAALQSYYAVVRLSPVCHRAKTRPKFQQQEGFLRDNPISSTTTSFDLHSSLVNQKGKRIMGSSSSVSGPKGEIERGRGIRPTTTTTGSNTRVSSLLVVFVLYFRLSLSCELFSFAAVLFFARLRVYRPSVMRPHVHAHTTANDVCEF